MTIKMDATAAYWAILRGNAPNGLVVDGDLAFDRLGRYLPEDLQVRGLDLIGIPWLYHLSSGLRCEYLTLRDLPLVALPEDLSVEHLDIERCTQLERLPATLAVKSLTVRDCLLLTALPECPKLGYLNISGCSGLRDWPATGPEFLGSLIMAGCTGLRALPPWLNGVVALDVRDCTALRELPEYLTIDRWADIGGCALQSLPRFYRNGLDNGVIRWRGVPIDEQIACHPETLRAQDVFKEQNTEIRRVMLERMGYERFLAEANAEVFDQDQDVGGPRRLLRVGLGEDEPLVCLEVRDPSTGRQYVLRVPPEMQSCHQAAAWMAGFEHPDDYQPITET